MIVAFLGRVLLGWLWGFGRRQAPISWFPAIPGSAN